MVHNLKRRDYKMDKLIVYDANGVKWIIQPHPEIAGYWCNVDDPECMRDLTSGYVEDSVRDCLQALNRDGYMWKEGDKE
jgi:hypothetical protein